jgi:AraC-like DNA-binding protein
MLGQGVSSDSIWTAFNNVTTAFTRVLKWMLKISWKRAENSSVAFAIVGTSLVGGIDIVQGQTSIITKPDNFEYFDETDRVISMEYDRELIEPLGGIAMAMMDVTLDNSDLRFTPEQNTTIGTAILPNRPINSAIGFEVRSQSKTIGLFKGLTKIPKENKQTRVVSISSVDYVKYLNEYPLETAIYLNKRSDEIIAQILADVGFGSSQYVLDEGLNTIGFAWFESGDTAGDRIKELCEAEEAFFYQDEGGLLRFENRRHFQVAPYNADVWDINSDDIISWEEDDSTPIYNHVTVTTNSRVVQTATEVWRDGDEEVINSGETVTIWASFNDPITTLVAPVSGTDYQAFTSTGGAGDDISAMIDITTTLFTTSVKLDITNNDDGIAYMPLLKLRGTPAVQSGEIKIEYQDDTSISKYEENVYNVSNDYIDSTSFAYYLAKVTVNKYKDPKRKIILTVQGIPHLQIRDQVRVMDQDTGVYTNFRVMRIQGSLSNGYFQQTLYLRLVDDSEITKWAVVGVTVVDSIEETVGI